MAESSKTAKLEQSPANNDEAFSVSTPYNLPSDIIGCIFRYCDTNTQMLFVGATKDFSRGSVWSHLHHLDFEQLHEHLTEHMNQKSWQEQEKLAAHLLQHFSPYVGSVRSIRYSPAIMSSTSYIDMFSMPLLKSVASNLLHLDISGRSNINLESVLASVNAEKLESLSFSGASLLIFPPFSQRKFPRLRHLDLYIHAQRAVLTKLLDILTESTGSLIYFVATSYDYPPAPRESFDAYLNALKRVTFANKGSLQTLGILESDEYGILNLPQDDNALKNVSWEAVEEQAQKDFNLPLSSLRLDSSCASLWSYVACKRIRPHHLDSLRERCWRNLPLFQRVSELLTVTRFQRNEVETVRYWLSLLKKLMEEWQQSCSDSTSVLSSLCELADKVLQEEKILGADDTVELATIMEHVKAGIIRHRAAWTIGPLEFFLERLAADRNFIVAAAPLNLQHNLPTFDPNEALKALNDNYCSPVERVLELLGDYVLNCTDKRHIRLVESILLTLKCRPDQASSLSLFRALLRVCNKYPQLGAPRFLDAFQATFKTPQTKEKALLSLEQNQDIFDSVIILMSTSEDSMLDFADLVCQSKYFGLLLSIQAAQQREQFIDSVWRHLFSTCPSALMLKNRVGPLVLEVSEHVKTAKLKRFLSNPSIKVFETVAPYEEVKRMLEKLLP